MIWQCTLLYPQGRNVCGSVQKSCFWVNRNIWKWRWANGCGSPSLRMAADKCIMIWQMANIQNLNHVAALVMYGVIFLIPKTKAKGLTTGIIWYRRSFNFLSQYRFLGLLFWFWVLSQSHCIIQELLHYCNLQLHYFFYDGILTLNWFDTKFLLFHFNMALQFFQELRLSFSTVTDRYDLQLLCCFLGYMFCFCGIIYCFIFQSQTMLLEVLVSNDDSVCTYVWCL